MLIDLEPYFPLRRVCGALLRRLHRDCVLA